MNHYSMGLTAITGAVLGIGAMYADFLARRMCDFLLVVRNRGRLDDLAKEIGSPFGDW
jgi:short-subunit dehydrogenase